MKKILLLLSLLLIVRRSKRIVSFLLLLHLGMSAYGQVIKGIILDKETRGPVPLAAVYFDGTSVATYSNDEGNFTLDAKSHSNMPMTISALGYYSIVVNEFSTTGENTVYLEPKIFEFKDVTIKVKGNSSIRKQNMAIFRREFLGRTKNAKECAILNENDIRFTKSDNKDTLRAYSLKPVFILNKALGYKITYYLNKFEYVESAYRNQLFGNSIFDDDTALIATETIRQRRDYTYYGSKMHFIRSVWQADLKPSGYSIKNGKKQINPQNIIRNQLSTTAGQNKKQIFYPEGVPVILSVKWGPGKTESGMELQRNSISIEENGFYKGPGIIWHGEMAKQGIADLLPYDFKPSGEFDDKYFANYRINDTISSDLITNVSELTEKVYLHTDRDVYSAGDDIWFKAYCVDGITHELSDSSGNLYVELISPESEILIKKTLKLQNGLGNGDFVLPENLPSGNYLLRAYTNFIRNFGDQAFYYKNIIITTGSELLHLANTSDSLINSPEQTDFQFFPEGGSLVENVSSVVAFKAVDKNGLGCEVNGQVYSSSGEQITTFKSTHLGIGKFNFRPEEGVTYTAVITQPDGSTIRRKIPSIFPRGFVLNVQTNCLNETLVKLNTNSKTYSGYKDRDVVVTVSSHGKILKDLKVRINALNAGFVLPEDLPDGIVMITMYGLDNKPLCERLVYVDNKLGIVLSFDSNQQYQKRDSVSIKFSVSDDYETENDAFLSLSVSNDIYSYSSPSTISSWFLLESDIRGPVENPSSYFDISNPSRLMDLDLLMLTQGWRDFKWKYNEERYFAENGFIISGRLRRSILDVPVINQEITLAVFQDKKNVITSTQTDSSGRFRFDLENLAGEAQIVINALNKRGNSAGRLILDSIKNVGPVVRRDFVNNQMLKVKHESPDNSQIKAADELKKNIKKKFTLSDTILIGEVQISGRKKESAQEIRIAQSREKYGTPDKEILVTPNFRNAGSIKELLTGKVGGLIFTKTSSPNESGIRIRGVSSMILSQEPLFLLDGVTVPYGILSSIPVSFIDRVDVIKGERAAAFGMQGANGIISVICKNSPEIAEGTITHSVNRTVTGFSEPRIFYSATHSSSLASDYKPDLRSTLLWMPNLKITENKEYRIKFFNGDIPSTYKLNIEGITSDGIPFSGQLKYEIR